MTRRRTIAIASLLVALAAAFPPAGATHANDHAEGEYDVALAGGVSQAYGGIHLPTTLMYGGDKLQVGAPSGSVTVWVNDTSGSTPAFQVCRGHAPFASISVGAPAASSCYEPVCQTGSFSFSVPENKITVYVYTSFVDSGTSTCLATSGTIEAVFA